MDTWPLGLCTRCWKNPQPRDSVLCRTCFEKRLNEEHHPARWPRAEYAPHPPTAVGRIHVKPSIPKEIDITKPYEPEELARIKHRDQRAPRSITSLPPTLKRSSRSMPYLSILTLVVALLAISATAYASITRQPKTPFAQSGCQAH